MRYDKRNSRKHSILKINSRPFMGKWQAEGRKSSPQLTDAIPANTQVNTLIEN